MDRDEFYPLKIGPLQKFVKFILIFISIKFYRMQSVVKCPSNNVCTPRALQCFGIPVSPDLVYEILLSISPFSKNPCTVLVQLRYSTILHFKISESQPKAY